MWVAHETTLQRLVRLNFWASVWSVVVLVVVIFAVRAAAPVEFWQRWSPYSGRVLMGGLALCGVELSLWYALFRHGGREARVAAGLMGAWFVIMILIGAAQASIDVPVSPWRTLASSYIAVSHLAYALVGSRTRF